MNEFLEIMYKIYDFICGKSSTSEKNKYIDNFKNEMKIDFKDNFSNRYFELIKNNKKSGIVYTPKEIADYMVENLINAREIIQNPYAKILDPACGCGNILCSCFNYLKKIFMENSSYINIKDIEKHIITYNLFGIDVDEAALIILKIDLFRLSGNLNKDNFVTGDFLLDSSEEKYEFIIGNPPYIGHKSVDKNYSEILRKKYKRVYKDKSDVSYCFFSKSIDCLKEKGRMSFIVSRYFCESPNGKKLRELIQNNTNIDIILDFYGIRPFKNVGIDPMIIFLHSQKNHNNKNMIKIIKPNNINKNFFIQQRELKSEGWILVDKAERKILEKITQKCRFLLSDICDSHQGIISGCDRAFILDYKSVEKYDIERDVVKPWIKSSYIDKYNVTRKGNYIIYLNNIADGYKYENAINYISRYKERLKCRRECKAGTRKWYELQWGRKCEMFEKKKILFPYKSSNNRFALDFGSYFSADIYCITLKKHDIFDYETLLYILNSTVYEFYIKTFAKKLGDDIYEYYPNKLMQLKIPRINKSKERGYLYKFFGFTENEIEIIESKCK